MKKYIFTFALIIFFINLTAIYITVNDPYPGQYNYTTISEAIARVRSRVKAVKQDASLTNRFLFSLIMKHAKFLMKRQDQNNRIMKFNSIFSTLNYVELIEVDAAEAECFGVSTNCTFKRTKDKLPKAMEGYYGPLLRSITSLDLTSSADHCETKIKVNTDSTEGRKCALILSA